ncbi:tryptophan 7-halogenase [Pseudoalteromonas sp. SR44-8]|uniref:tryptophan 7-halogenase n=1 Tax=Pseudoalteromonas sp. SR44-8 TaxID=2760933 RepID=UPI001602CA96|nr:tryptophan 7-halogenase [Pseudoalteromonas sp. SR44-8]MBB1303188.1 tryptophan 7-halogenase [Pseudoalteromonas sp. SR44-8]
MLQETELQTDVVIIGAGVAGCIAALALCDSYQVTLIDKSEMPEERIGECLAPAARRILQQLDLLTEFENQLVANVLTPQHLHNAGLQISWGQSTPYVTDNLSNPDGLGWRLDRQVFESFLREKALQRGVRCIWPAKLAHSEYQGQRWQITLTQLQQEQTINIASQFVIDATGREAHFAKKYTARKQHDRLISCWATVANTIENQLGSICATQNGWWYSAPLPNQRRVLAFQTDPDLLTKGLQRDAKLFTQHAQCYANQAKILDVCQQPITLHGIVSANSTRLDCFAGQQWAALGDAALSFDPISSQGIFNAMASAMQLADLMKKLDIVNKIEHDSQLQFKKLYQQQIEQIWHRYLDHKHYFYAQEQRWSNSPFWQRRQQPSSIKVYNSIYG